MYTEDFLPAITNIVVSIVVIVSFIAGILWFCRSIDASSCSAFGAQSGREVKFVNFNFASWDCLTPSKDGKWISVYNLRDITD